MSSTSAEAPAKNDIQQIFKRLRSVQANKICFDCHSKNPTWASVTYGIFICIDCSGIHRSLGVHLTFVRSTQLDFNWTWQQLRQMQLGGNSNATTFFRQHNCGTNDVQQKYKSRAAQLYREKLHHQAAKAMRLHGTKVFIETSQNNPAENEDTKEEEEDFFEKHEENAKYHSDTGSTGSSTVSIKNGNKDLSESGPSVEAALSMSPTTATESQTVRKSTIGQRKPAKKGLGARKGGLGAQKVKKDFAEIEREAEMADQVKSRVEEERKEAAKRTEEDDAKALASVRLAYQDLSIQQKKKEEKLRTVDPKKAEQVERLGMGVGSSSGRVSHSAITEMSAIKQEEPRNLSSNSSKYKNYSKSKNSNNNDFDFEDDEEDYFKRMLGSSSNSRSKNRDDFDKDDDEFSGFSNNNNTWEKEFEVMKSTKSSKNDEWSNNFEEVPKRNNSNNFKRSTMADPEEAQKKFSGAKAISSDMFFGDNDRNGADANVNRFQGSSSISSAEYFGREETTPGSRYNSSIQAPDMEDVKESVRQGVSRVAGRLSNMASGVMTQLQTKTGYGKDNH